MRKLAVLCLAVLALAGCGAITNTYEGPTLPEEERAGLIAQYRQWPWLPFPMWDVMYVNGERVNVGLMVSWMPAWYINMKPGPKKVEAKRHVWAWEDSFCTTLSWDAEAGVFYKLETRALDTLSIVTSNGQLQDYDYVGEEVVRSPVVPCTAS